MERSLITIIDIIVNTVSIILILHALMSFAPLDPYHPVRRMLADIAEPIIRPFRNLIPPVGMFDFSVMVAIIVIQIGGELLKAMIRSAF
ncbi:MAG: YggT family protein [Anaerolineales bacterium]|nr:YggT family protein [Anaerolineales bacterium]MDW8326706.1 YggT family protein [Anaerolineales bacterium]